MKSRLCIVASLILNASPAAFANTELETLRARCSEQERQIRHLEDENSKLRSLSGEKASKPAAPAAPAKAETAPPPPPSPTSSPIYVVKTGDNLVKIARQVGMSSDKLAKANGIRNGAIIRPGQKLKIPGTAVTDTTQPSLPSAPQKSAAPRTHTVRADETYSSISRKYKISTNALIAANPKIKPTSLRKGQIINLEKQAAPPAQTTSAPVPPPVPPPAPTPTPPVAKAPPTSAPSVPAPLPTPQPTASPATPAPATPAPAAQAPSVEKKVRPIVIEQEITYGDFASKHGTDTERLNALNGLDLTPATVLAKGSELYVPGQ